MFEPFAVESRSGLTDRQHGAAVGGVLMKVAIPLFKDRVSPHFSTALEALLVQIEGGKVCCTWKIDLDGLRRWNGVSNSSAWGSMSCSAEASTGRRDPGLKTGLRVEDNRWKCDGTAPSAFECKTLKRMEGGTMENQQPTIKEVLAKWKR